MNLKTALAKYPDFVPVLPLELHFGTAYIFDLSSDTSPFKNVDFHNVQTLTELTRQIIRQHNAIIGIGRYAEKRHIYQHFDLFNNNAIRSVHLGVDLTVPIDTAVAAPLKATVHSLKDNQQAGDYGPTVILQHMLDDICFYTLYGHLSRRSLQDLNPGQFIAAGKVFASVGNTQQNGGWVPHLHFQIIKDLGDHWGDYPGICASNEKEYYLQNCPDPNLILRLSLC